MLSVGIIPVGFNDGTSDGIDDTEGPLLGVLVTFDGLGDGSLLVEGLPLGCAVGFTPDGFSEIIAEGVADPVGALVFPSWQSAMFVTAPDPLR